MTVKQYKMQSALFLISSLSRLQVYMSQDVCTTRICQCLVMTDWDIPEQEHESQHQDETDYYPYHNPADVGETGSSETKCNE